MRRLLLILSVCVYYVELNAQHHSGYSFQHLSTSDGLSQNSIPCVMQDRQGMIWVATQSGIDKYLGNYFRYYDKVEKGLIADVTYLFDWDEHNILVATVSGNMLVNKWDKKVPSRALDDTLKSILFIEKVSEDSFLVITQTEMAWANSKLELRKQITWTGGRIYQVVKHEGKYYIASNAGMQVFDLHDQSIRPLGESRTRAVCIDQSGNHLYFGSTLSDIQVYDLKTNTKLNILNIPAAKISRSDTITALFSDRDGVLWVGTEAQGLLIFDIGKSTLHAHFTSDKAENDPQYFSGKRINCINSSKEGVVWVGMDKGGLNLWQPGRIVFENLLSQEVPDDNDTRLQKVVWSIYAAPNDDKIWVGLDKEGILCLSAKDKRVIQRIRSADPKLAPSAFVMREHHGRFYIGTENGIYTLPVSNKAVRYEPHKVDNRRVLGGKRVSMMVFDPGNSCWYAGSRQEGIIYKLSEGFEQITTITLNQNKPTFMLPSKQGLWVGAVNGLYLIAPGTNSPQIAYQKKDTSIYFTCAVVSGNKLWAGTDRKGLFAFDIATDGRLLSPKCYNGKKGFPFEVIYELQTDTLGYIWLSTNHGLYRFDPNTQSFNHYVRQHGLKVVEFNTGAVYREGNCLYFGGVGGLCHFDAYLPVDKSFPFYKPVVDVKYFGKKSEERIIDYNNEEVHHLFLPYKFGYLVLRPALGHYHDGFNNAFIVTLNDSILQPMQDGLYLIEESNLRSTWAGIGRRNKVTITYRSGNGVWNEPVEIKIRREFFNDSDTILLVVLSILLLLLTLYFAYVYVRNTRLLDLVHKKINEISKLEETDKIGKIALGHLTRDVGYEYALIALVDFDKRRIHIEDIEDPALDDKQKEQWKKNSNYPLSSEDILARVARLGEPAIVIGNKHIYHSAISADEKNLFNSHIAVNLEHEDLARVFIPFVHRYQENKEENAPKYPVALGVVEVGFRMQAFDRFFIQKKINWLLPVYRKWNVEGALKYKLPYLKLYVDNLAQPYFKAFIREEKRKIYDLVENELEKTSNQKEEDSNTFLRRALQAITERIQAQSGAVALSSFNTIQPEYDNDQIFFDADNGDRDKRVQTLRNATHQQFFSEVGSDNAVYYSDESSTGITYKSAMLLPMSIHQSAPLYGVFTLMSDQLDFFNPVLKEVYQKAARKITDVYLQKKRYEALQKIAQPLNQVSQTQESLYKELSMALKVYFKSDFISIWVRTIPSNWEFSLSPETDATFYQHYKEIGFLNKEINPENEKKLRDYKKDILVKKDRDDHPVGTRIRTLCDKHGFVSYIILKIIRDDRYQAFINVFSRRPISEDEISGYSKTLLEEVALKAALAERSIFLFDSFREIAKSLATEQENKENSTLKKIVSQAFLLAPSADSVVLFPYRNEPIRIKHAVVGGRTLPPEDERTPDRKANLANYILENGTHYFNEKAEYMLVATKTDMNRREEGTFWVVRKLQSVAAIRMEYDGQPVGVMIFNYTDKKAFEETDKQSIEAFANYATIALINENYIRRLREESARLNERIQQLAAQEKAAKREMEHLFKEKKEQESLLQKISEKAAGESFFVILQGINHDIRNLLLSMEGRLEIYGEKLKESKDKEEFDSISGTLRQQSNKIGALLNLFRPSEIIKRERFNINETILKVTHIFGTSHATFVFNQDFGKNIPSLICNKTEFSMVIYNLIKNAVSAIEEKSGQKGEISLSTRFENKYFIIKVSDNGTGIDNDLQERIFHLGYTTKKDGTGVGLYFVKETVENKWDGSIQVMSQNGKGSTFIIKIPEYINFKN